MTRRIAAALVVGLLVGLLIGTLLPGRRPAVGRRPIGVRSSDGSLVSSADQHLSLGGNIGPDHVRTTSCSSGTPAIWQSIDGTIFKLGC